jgi:dihydroorotate dehydrogenase (NAD+) catalytic subunit
VKFDLAFDPPLMNAAGALGFAPDVRGPIDLARLGAFITNPVSLPPRAPAQGARFLAYPGGFLLHTGHPNPGLSAVIRRYAPRWARSPLPVLVHLLCQGVDELREMVRRLEGQAGVAGFELGMPPDVDATAASALAQAASGELPVIVRLPMERAAQLAPAVAAVAPWVTFSLGPPRGALPLPTAGVARGRLYGPAIFPFALAALRDLVGAGLPVIASGGVFNSAQVQALLAAGALAVQLDAVLWRGGW